MKLQSFRIQHFKSIQDTGEVVLDSGRISIFAGQNESGKSSILEALNAYEQEEFDADSLPFDGDGAQQSISCTYVVEKEDQDFWEEFENRVAEDFGTPHEKSGDVFDLQKICESIPRFTVTKSIDKAGKLMTSVDESILQIISAATIKSPIEIEEKQADGTVKKRKETKKVIDLDASNLSDVASELWRGTPNLILFNDFCDLLPDKFSIADLKAKKADAKGYKAVMNFQKLSGADFLKLYELDDLRRDSAEEKHNETISIDFMSAWKQKIHTDNKVKLAYKFEKRDTEENSYVMFYVETKDKQKIRPRMRSKGLVWFLSFWMELQASGNSRKIILADEPGLYLHIRAQEDILAVFDGLATKGHQVLYSTHSPNLIKTDHLERINLVVNDQFKGTLVEGVTSAKIDTQNKQDALQPVANAIGFSVSDFALPVRRTVILEGVSDYFYYLAMRKLLKRRDDYVFVPGIGVRKQHALVSFCVGYGIDWVAIFDDDSIRGLDSQKTFADIKARLFDDDDDAAKRKMHITTGVSSVENMFTIDDLKLVDSKLSAQSDAATAIGDRRKVVFSKTFFEKVDKGEITRKKLQESTVENFSKIFDWIEQSL